MNDWVGLINSVRDNSFDKDKYQLMGRVNGQSLLVGGNNNSNGNQLAEKTNNNPNNIPPINNPKQTPIPITNKQASYNPFN